MEVVVCESANYMLEVNGLTMKTCLCNWFQEMVEDQWPDNWRGMSSWSGH